MIRDFLISILLLAGTIALYISFRWMEEPRAVVILKKGDEVMAYFEEGGRHFGTSIKETILEK